MKGAVWRCSSTVFSVMPASGSTVFYLGSEPSGYAAQVYYISEYLNYGGENVVAVRADATLEEGWFYEGAGIYRHVWLDKTDNLHVAPFGTFVSTDLKAPYDEAVVRIETNVGNYDVTPRTYSLKHTLLDADGIEVAYVSTDLPAPFPPRTTVCRR